MKAIATLPTFEEAGLKGFVVDTWYGLMAPAGTPTDILRSLEREATAFGKSPEVRERLEAAGMEPQSICGDAFAKQISQEIVSNNKLAHELGLKAE